MRAVYAPAAEKGERALAHLAAGEAGQVHETRERYSGQWSGQRTRQVKRRQVAGCGRRRWSAREAEAEGGGKDATGEGRRAADGGANRVEPIVGE